VLALLCTTIGNSIYWSYTGRDYWGPTAAIRTYTDHPKFSVVQTLDSRYVYVKETDNEIIF
jgi:hypothetical protein